MAHTGVRQGKFWLILVVGCWVVCLVRLCLPSSPVPPRACLCCFVLFCSRRCVCFAFRDVCGVESCRLSRSAGTCVGCLCSFSSCPFSERGLGLPFLLFHPTRLADRHDVVTLSGTGVSRPRSLLCDRGVCSTFPTFLFCSAIYCSVLHYD